MVTVGDGSCGKACLLITYNIINLLKFLSIWIVLSLTTTKLRFSLMDNLTYSDCGALQGRMTMTVWDHYHTLIPIAFGMLCNFHPKLIWNVTAKWIPDIQHYCPTVPFFIVWLKTDLRTYNDKKKMKNWKHINYRSPISTEAGIALAEKVGAYACVEYSALTQAGLNLKVLCIWPSSVVCT